MLSRYCDSLAFYGRSKANVDVINITAKVKILILVIILYFLFFAFKISVLNKKTDNYIIIFVTKFFYLKLRIFYIKITIILFIFLKITNFIFYNNSSKL